MSRRPLRPIAFACLRASVVLGAALAFAQIQTVGIVDADAARRAILLTGVGAAFGCAAAGFQMHPRRSLGLVAPAATGLFVLLLAAAIFNASWSWPFSLALGLFAVVHGSSLACAPLFKSAAAASGHGGSYGLRCADVAPLDVARKRRPCTAALVVWRPGGGVRSRRRRPPGRCSPFPRCELLIEIRLLADV